jgi:hypothetical protein
MKYMEILEGSSFTQSLIKKLAPPLGTVYTAISIKVVPEQSRKVDYFLIKITVDPLMWRLPP